MKKELHDKVLRIYSRKLVISFYLRNIFATFYSFKADERRPSTGSSLYHTLYSSSSSSSESGSEESESEDDEEESEEGSGEESESESEDESESESEEDETQDGNKEEEKEGNKEEEKLEVKMEIEQPIGEDQEMVAVLVKNKQGNKFLKNWWGDNTLYFRPEYIMLSILFYTFKYLPLCFINFLSF